MTQWKLDGCIWAQNLDIVCGSNRIAMIDCENEALCDGDIIANARLIAAAPQMKTALDALVVNYAQTGRVTDHFVQDVARMLEGLES
jgi:hypothetical protein